MLLPVDWASLAKQWIAQRDVMTLSATHDGASSAMYMPSAVVPPPPPPLPAEVDGCHLLPPTSSANEVGPVIGGGPLVPDRVENIVDNSNSQGECQFLFL